MKTKLLIALFILINFAGYSQQKIDYAFIGGINFNKAEHNPDYLNESNLFGYNGGLQVQYHFAENFSIKNRVQYNQKGYKFKSLMIEYPDLSIGKADILTRYDYIDIKILPSFNMGNKVKFSTFFGPNIGFLTESTLITKYKDGNMAGTDYNVNRGSELAENINFALVAGVGGLVKLSSKLHLSVDVLYDHGFSNVQKIGESKLRTVSFTGGIVYCP